MSIINAINLSKTYKVHEKQEGLKNTIKDLFNTLMSISEKPKEIFSYKQLMYAFVFLIPSIPLANVPASILLDKGNVPGMIAAAVSGVLFFMASASAIKKGIRRYSSASS